MIHLKDIENQLTQLVAVDKKAWVSFYRLIKEVEEKELYKETGLKSFTAWVKTFSEANKIHESIIWNRKKAGKVYEIYEQRQAQKGVAVAKLEEVDIPADSLVLLDKIAKRSPELGEQMVEKVLNNELTREDLRQTYRTLRDSGKKTTSTALTSNDEEVDSDMKQEPETINDAEMTTVLTSDLMKNIDWLNEFGDSIGITNMQVKRNVGEFKLYKHKTFAEFAVYTGSSKKSRRIDVMVAENHYAEIGEVNLHAVEVKVSVSDLKNDKKYTEYAEFMDYVWLAIPQELLEVALENTPRFLGIILYQKAAEDTTSRNLVIYRNAEKRSPLMKQEALTTALLKLI